MTGQASFKADSAKDSASRKADKAGNKAEGQYKEGKKAWWQFWKNDVQVRSISHMLACQIHPDLLCIVLATLLPAAEVSSS